MQHRHVTTEWTTAGYFGRFDCVCCGFTIIGENRALHVRHRSGRASAVLCDGCVNAVAAEADGRQVLADGTAMIENSETV